jgi:GNAT superfamily N-acetyltransferase
MSGSEKALRWELTDAPMPGDLEAVFKGLDGYNAADVGPSEKKIVAVLVRDDTGALVGGLNGYTAWGWLFTQWLWLAEPLRGQGLAGKLLEMAEDESRKRGCRGAWIDTFNPVARRAYERQGYTVFGELEDFPPGRTRWFLRKTLG